MYKSSNPNPVRLKGFRTLAKIFFEEMFQEDEFFKRRIAYYIDEAQKEQPIYTRETLLEARNHGQVIKIERMEHYSRAIEKLGQGLALQNGLRQYGDYDFITCHAFLGQKDSQSFPLHTDPVPVVLYMLKGSKTIWCNDVEYYLEEGEALFIPPNTPHFAIYTGESIMLSFGYEPFFIRSHHNPATF